MNNKITFTREQLYDLVWSEPMLTLSKKYNISDVGLRKNCIKLNIPLPQSGYWTKLKFGKKVKRTSLPKDDNNQQITLTLRNENSKEITGELSPLKILTNEIEVNLSNKLNVPERLNNPDKLVTDLKVNLNNQKADTWDYIGFISNDLGFLDTRITVKNISRTLCFWDTLIKCLRSRGHDVFIRYHETRAVLGDFDFKILLRERTKREPFKDGNYERTRHISTGILYFQVYNYPSREWKDGKLSLGEQISRIIAHLELAAKEKAEIRLINQRLENERKEKEKIQREFEMRQEEDLSEFKKILDKAERWHKTVNLRNYINELELKALNSQAFTTELKSWLEWARKKADWYDPFIEAEDELLKKVDRKTLSLPKKEFFY